MVYLSSKAKETALAQIRQYLAYAEARALVSSIKKGVWLVLDKQCALVHVAEVLKLNRSALRRAVEASKNKREIGINGHPRALSDDQEQELIRMIFSRAQDGLAVSIPEFMEAVCSLFLIQTLLFLIFPLLTLF